MAEVKHLDQLLIFVNLVIRQDWAMDQLSNPRAAADDRTHAWTALQEIQMVKQGSAKSGSGFGVVSGNVRDGPSQIV